MRRLLASIALFALLGAVLPAAAAPPGPAGAPPQERACRSLSLDGAPLLLCAPALPGAPFIEPAPDDALQVASAVDLGGPFWEVSVRALPFGTRLGDWPPVGPGSAATYRALLRSLRADQGGAPAAAPAALLFGQRVEGLASVVDLYVRGETPQPVALAEWVTEAGGRIWIVRLSREVSPTLAGAALPASPVPALSGPHPLPPSTSAASLRAERALALASAATAAAGDLPVPPWWNGDCDTNYYFSKAGRPAYPLGGIYRNVKACGPRPWADGAPNVLVYFFPGAWGQYEWQCPELSKRFMYLAYEIAPYPANGNMVVQNCNPTTNGCWLQKVANGTVGRAPLPGNVLSYGPTDPYGHTSVVKASSVNASGNGTVTVIEQNSSATGERTLTVSNWYVQASMAVSGWLHDAGNFSVPVAPRDLTLAGPALLPVAATGRFTATVGRVATLQPLTYVWRASGQSPVTRTAGLSDVLSVAWAVSGTQVLTVTVRNAAGAVQANRTLLVTGAIQRVHVPLALADSAEPEPSPPCAEGLVNGGFEETGAWELVATPCTAGYSAAQAHSGARSMRTGLVPPDTDKTCYSSARQLVTIPADALSVTLRVWLYPLSQETLAGMPPAPAALVVEPAGPLANDAQYVAILDAANGWRQTLLSQRSNAAAWTFHQFNLAAYKGQSIKVYFGVYNNGTGGVTGMYVDDASLEICRP